MHDISALSFLEVQLNLAYRRHWDDRIVFLDYTDLPRPGDDTVGCLSRPLCSDTIRWVARFPLPLANREYLYHRRWWLEQRQQRNLRGDGASARGPHAIVVSRSATSGASDGLQTRPAGRVAWTDKFKRSPVSVVVYRSEMLIRAHAGFHEVSSTSAARRLVLVRPTVGVIKYVGCC